MALAVLLILILAAGTSYWLIFQQHPPTATSTTGPVVTVTTHPPIQFAFLLGPPFFHVAPHQGRNITAFVTRASGFSGAITVDIVSPPNWVTYRPATIGPTATNDTLTVIATKDAPKTELNLTVRASSSGAADQFALLDMKVVGVSNVTDKFGSAVVYDTTKVLLGDSLKALTGYTNYTLVFSAVTPQLQSLARGDVIIIPPGKTQLVKYGLMRNVVSVTHQGSGIVVNTVPASLLDEFQQLEIGNNRVNVTYSSSMSPASSISPAGWYGPTWFTLVNEDYDTGSVDVGGGDILRATGNFWAGFTPAVHVHWGSWCDCVPSIDIFYVHGGVRIDGSVSLVGTAGTGLDWVNSNLKELLNKQIPIMDDLLWITLGLYLEARASGNLNQNINLNMYTDFGFEIGPTYDTDPDCPGTNPHEQCGGWFMYKDINGPSACMTTYSQTCWNYAERKLFPLSLVSPGSGTAAKVGIGPRFEISINAGLGDIVNAALWGSISADVYWELDSLIPNKPSSWWINGGMEAYVGIGLRLSALWGLFSWGVSIDPLWEGPILGPNLLLNGDVYPPIVTVINPQPEQVVDVSSGIMAPGFKATATSPQDGDICNAPGVTLVWTDEDGQIGTGCNLPGELFKHDGDYHIVFTATDTGGRATSSPPIHIIVRAPEAKPYIVNPRSTQTIYVGDPVMLIGGASFGLTDMSCDKIFFNYFPPSGQGSPVLSLATTKYVGPECMVNLPNGFASAGQWKIELWAVGPNGPATTFIEINVLALPTNPQTPLPPYVAVIQPESLVRYGDKEPIQGTIKSRQAGQSVGKYVWTAAAGSNPATTLGSGDLSNDPCGTSSGGCSVSAILDASTFCSSSTANPPITVTVTLTAYQQSLSFSQQVSVTLYCQKVGAPPPFSLSWASWGGILLDQWSSSSSRSEGKLIRLARLTTGDIS